MIITRFLRTLLLNAIIVAVPIMAHATDNKSTNFTVRDLKGKHLRLSDFKHQLVLMAFWATWCKPCLVELQHLEKLYQKYKGKGLIVLGVSIDSPESQASVKPMVQRYNLSFPIVIDRETRIVKLYNPKHAAPFTVMLKQGKKIKSREGFQLSDLPMIEKELQELLR